MRRIFLLLSITLVLVSCKQVKQPATENQEAVAEEERVDSIVVPDFTITIPPDSLKLDKFYTRYVDVNGIPLVSSWRVPDSCYKAAFKTLYSMTSMLSPKVLEAMHKGHARVGIMARYEGTTDIPEHHYLINDTTLNWNLRARGLGGDLNEPLTTCAEENILAYQIDKYHAEDILIHEFSHAIHLIGVIQVDKDINDTLTKLLNNAKSKGLWANTYAETDIAEYWAEGVQDWFNVNAEVARPDGKHNWVNTREELQEYDPDLYNLLAKYFPKTNQQISKHKKVNEFHNPSK
ncbi:MAG: hypothetical protein ACTTKN_09510 [Phocaeicola sp.]|uniref:hypothetical protein n=1 Tax=Phocaeicola TaxID=909656 RepID=UPI00234EA569|nr:hypothetical protein [Phocaeicola oris]MCE2616839.1 hypothetical protein [Phocaeicola oris]